MKRLLVVVLLIGCMISVAYGRDRDVRAIVTAMERQYGLHHEGLPWAVRVMMKPFTWSKGTTVSVEFFENQSLPASASMQELESLSAKALGPAWRRFVRVDSRRDREKTLIYAKPDGKQMVLLIITAEAHETNVVKVKVDPSEARSWMDDPETMSSRHGKNESRAQGQD